VFELCKHYPKFLKTADKGMYEFDHDLLECTPSGFERVYFLFLIDSKHWVGLCLDVNSRVITVLDCYIGLWRETKLKNVILPLAEMLPYLFRFASKKGGEKKLRFKAFVVHMENEVPQADVVQYSGVFAAHLIEVHADGEIQSCKEVTHVAVVIAATFFLLLV